MLRQENRVVDLKEDFSCQVLEWSVKAMSKLKAVIKPLFTYCDIVSKRQNVAQTL